MKFGCYLPGHWCKNAHKFCVKQIPGICGIADYTVFASILNQRSENFINSIIAAFCVTFLPVGQLKDFHKLIANDINIFLCYQLIYQSIAYQPLNIIINHKFTP